MYYTQYPQKKELLEQWVIFYPDKLKQKYLLGRYNINNTTVNEIDIEKYNALFGGETAAAKLTNFLRPFIHTIYIKNKTGEFILKNRLTKDPNGNLLLKKKFWNFEDIDYPGITPPILVYADLLATGDPRNIETANIIYEKDIVRYLR